MSSRGFVFNYGTMGSGKTLELMKMRHNYIKSGKKVLVAKHSIDLKGAHEIESRAGGMDNIPVDVLIGEHDEPYDKILRTIGHKSLRAAGIRCTFFDEVQFFSGDQINDIDANIARLEGIEVQAFGLKTDFIGEIFPGAAQAFARADEFRELRGIVCSCNSGIEPLFNARYTPDMIPIFKGDQVSIDGLDSIYVPLCRNCYLEELINAHNKNIPIDDRLLPMLKIALIGAGVVTTTDK